MLRVCVCVCVCVCERDSLQITALWKAYIQGGIIVPARPGTCLTLVTPPPAAHLLQLLKK